MSLIKVVDKIGEYPGLRNCSISENSGEEFYHKFLNEAFKSAFLEKSKLIIDIDGTGGYASSFLDEAFGNLVFDFSLKNVKNTLEIISLREPHWKRMIEEETYPQWEKRRLENQNPKVTTKHAPWFRLVNGTLQSKIWETPQD